MTQNTTIQTNPDYWDCECEENYIHPKLFIRCPKCQATQSDSPDSRQNEIDKLKDEISNLSHEEMAILWRFASPGHPYFDKRLAISEFFSERYTKLGKMTSSISKSIGWEEPPC